MPRSSDVILLRDADISAFRVIPSGSIAGLRSDDDLVLVNTAASPELLSRVVCSSAFGLFVSPVYHDALLTRFVVHPRSGLVLALRWDMGGASGVTMVSSACADFVGVIIGIGCEMPASDLKAPIISFAK